MEDSRGVGWIFVNLPGHVSYPRVDAGHPVGVLDNVDSGLSRPGNIFGQYIAHEF